MPSGVFKQHQQSVSSTDRDIPIKGLPPTSPRKYLPDLPQVLDIPLTHPPTLIPTHSKIIFDIVPNEVVKGLPKDVKGLRPTYPYPRIRIHVSVSMYSYPRIRIRVSVYAYPYPRMRIRVSVSAYPYPRIRIRISISAYLYPRKRIHVSVFAFTYPSKGRHVPSYTLIYFKIFNIRKK